MLLLIFILAALMCLNLTRGEDHLTKYPCPYTDPRYKTVNKMQFQSTEIKITLTIREAQSILCALQGFRSTQYRLNNGRSLIQGMRDDCEHAIRDLDNLLAPSALNIRQQEQGGKSF